MKMIRVAMAVLALSLAAACDTSTVTGVDSAPRQHNQMGSGDG